jgi:hypothetical protein
MRASAPLAPGDKRPKAICVLGPGRTGTSLTARILGLAGVHLGSDPELLSRTGIPANPRGFWEHRGLSRINQRVLRRLGGSWDEPPSLPSGWQQSESLAAEREEAARLLEQAFGAHPLWGWKDSRNSLTLPFWQELLPDDRYETRYVICLRNPVDVAASLTPPRPLGRAESVALWATYVAAALVNTSGRPRLILPFESYFDDWQGTVGRLLRFAGLEPPPPGSEIEARMQEFTDSGLWRHRTEPAVAMEDPAVGAAARSLYLVASLLAVAEPGPGMHEAADGYARRLLGGELRR